MVKKWVKSEDPQTKSSKNGSFSTAFLLKVKKRDFLKIWGFCEKYPKNPQYSGFKKYLAPNDAGKKPEKVPPFWSFFCTFFQKWPKKGRFFSVF
jgi:hypothetical protein